ncbi:MAG: hypothetical protein AB7P17_13600 [Nitrospirales bacterium]|nr:hypothetical protein [Nitrospirales bacterium]
MPHNNNFQHATYTRSDPGDRVRYRTFQQGLEVDSPGWSQVMGQVGSQLSQAGVKGILFFNGHPYVDLFGSARLDEVGGLKRGYSRGVSGLESLLALLRPATNGIYHSGDSIHPPLKNDPVSLANLDRMAKEVGNFTTTYVQGFAKAIRQNGLNSMVCNRYVWSSVNHHLGRVEAAVELLEYLGNWLKEDFFEQGGRVLLIGHGHAGQILALLSNFLSAGDAEARPGVFEVLGRYWQACPDKSHWLDRLEALYQLVSDGRLLNGVIVDIVTLGTPIRHGWDTSGIGKLLHMVNHRSIRPDGKRWLSKMDLPQIAWELPYLSGGDYVQQLAVAGTDEWPTAAEAQQAIEDFRDIFEPYDGFERWLECVRRSTRCHNDGTCLLIDYPVQPDSEPREHLFGHGCYTESRAMYFMIREIVGALYDESNG